MKLVLALLVTIAIGACTRIVVLSGPPDAGIGDARPPDARPDAGHDGGAIGDASVD